MWMEATVAVAIYAIGVKVLAARWRRRLARGFVDAGSVSPGWLAQHGRARAQSE